ncbi:hypothetical protein [Streptomyces boncukensis]|uniref:Uncharacterized protein n=1 Tax=Streptomyces boncukensis TaxID=2711219 RepID=A0A6G4X0Y7_9ACTN|nr:hypothetical protein [Streptomyces boncukensis]NGO71206.1 hypothetical protein [Streptomyces boncukensis]
MTFQETWAAPAIARTGHNGHDGHDGVHGVHRAPPGGRDPRRPGLPEPPEGGDPPSDRGERDLGTAPERYLAQLYLTDSGPGLDPEGDLADDADDAVDAEDGDDIEETYRAVGTRGGTRAGGAPHPG